eukprot:s1401_g3.t1
MAKKRKAASQATPEDEALDFEDDGDGQEEAEDEEEIVDAEAEDDGEGDEEEAPKMIWRPGIDALEDGEQLDVEPGTYDMLHRAQVEWPCLSVDVIRDDLGAQRSTFPMTAYVVAGSQASRTEDNRLYVMKWHKLYKTSKDGREDEEDEEESDHEDSEDEHEAALESKATPHPGGVNRVRAMPQAGHIVATWADTGKVHMWNLDAQRKALDKGDRAAPQAKPIFTCESHKDEGFALDFSPNEAGRFLSGSNDSQVLLWGPVPGGWTVESQQPFKGHKSSVEDVQWKKLGNSFQSTFASCSSDGSFKVWDIREKDRKKPAINVSDAHGGSDVNVLSWSPIVGELIVTGAIHRTCGCLVLLNGEDLERILQQHQERVRTAQGVQRHLEEELQPAAGDARQLVLGLPQLLDQRVSKLKRQQQLRVRNQQRDSEISKLKDQLAKLHLEASELQGKAASMRLQHQRFAKLALDAESEAQELRQCLQVKQGTDEIQMTYLRSRLELTQRLRQEIPQWQSQVLQLEQLLAQQREKLKAGTCGDCIAQPAFRGCLIMAP